jgi:hypothetical protein
MPADVTTSVVFGIFGAILGILMLVLAIFALWKDHFNRRRGSSSFLSLGLDLADFDQNTLLDLSALSLRHDAYCGCAAVLEVAARRRWGFCLNRNEARRMYT